MEKLAASTGGNIVNKISELEASDLGTAGLVEVKKIQDEGMTFISGLKTTKSVSILIRGGTKHIVDEIERSLIDAWSVVKVAIEDGMMVTGGGSTAVEIAMRLRNYAQSVGGREQIAIDAFASAMEVIPTTLAENAGLDPIDILIEMRKQHKAGKLYAGLNPFTGKVEDMLKLNVIEPHSVHPLLGGTAALACHIGRIGFDLILVQRGSAVLAPECYHLIHCSSPVECLESERGDLGLQCGDLRLQPRLHLPHPVLLPTASR